jgi:Protein of unknown function (DUF3237)
MPMTGAAIFERMNPMTCAVASSARAMSTGEACAVADAATVAHETLIADVAATGARALLDLIRHALLATALAMPVVALAQATAPAPKLTYVFSIKATLAPPLEQGVVEGKRRRFIGITGGTVSGPRLQGTVLAGGGDWQAIGSDGRTEIGARYSLKATDGTVIALTNPGLRIASPEVTAQIAAGKDVTPDAYYFRTAPTFDVADGSHSWMRRTLFVARGIRRPDHVVVDFYTVD